MILPEDRPASPVKSSQQTQPPPPEHLPSYGEAQSSCAGPSQPQPIYLPMPVHVEEREPAAKRFLKAFLVALGIWVLFGILTRSLVEAGSYPPRHGGHSRNEWEDMETARPLPADGSVLHCAKGSEGWTHNHGRPELTFKIDSFEDALYLFNRGQRQVGDVDIVQDESLSDPGVAYIDVAAIRDTPKWLHAVSVCALQRRSGQQGVGIFSPTRWRSDPYPSFSFNVTIRLPRTRDVLHLNKLETHMSNFRQHVGDFRGHVLFETVSLTSSNMPIDAKSLTAVNADIASSNGRIDGDFEASESLKLKTSNSAINVSATIVHTNAAHTPNLELKTTNGPIDSSVSLLSTASSADPAFSVQASTSNSRLSLMFPSAPVDSLLDLTARTSNGRAHVQLHPTFEGSFKVHTSNTLAAVHADDKVPDPKGAGRTRRVSMGGRKGEAWGTVSWDTTRKTSGRVDLRTSNAMAELYL